MNSLSEYFVQHLDEKCSSLAPNVHLFRFRVVEGFMAAGIGIAKVGILRNLLERTGNTTGDQSELRSFIPKVEGVELDKIRVEATNQYINSIFDATPRLGDLLNNVLRWCTEDFVIVQRLALLITYAKHLAGLQTATVLTTLYMTRLQLRIPQLINFDRDSVAANGVTVRSLRTTFTSASDVLCVSHTVCNAGKHIALDLKVEFMTKFIGIIYGNSKAAYNLWRRTIDQSIIGFSAVRWYCQVEIEMQIAVVFPFLRPFLVKLVDDDLCPTLGPAALAIYDRDPLQLKVEFAATVDVKMLVEACYNLEGDGLVVLMAYGVLSSLIAFGHRLQHPGYLPTAEAVLRASAVLSKGGRVRWSGKCGRATGCARARLWVGVSRGGKTRSGARARAWNRMSCTPCIPPMLIRSI